MSYNWESGSIGEATNIVREGSEIFADLTLWKDYDFGMFEASIYATNLMYKDNLQLNSKSIYEMQLRAVTLLIGRSNYIW